MKVVLFLAAAGALAFASAPAFTQTSPPPPADTGYSPPHGVQDLRDSPYRGPDFRADLDRCFNGRYVVGANRAGPSSVIVQPRWGPIYQLQLADDCEALNGAQKITVQASGQHLVCAGRAAVLISHTATGAKQCRISKVHRLTSAEVAALSTATVRP